MRKGLYLLGELDDEDLTWMSEAGRLCTIDKGEVLIEAGQSPAALFVVADGQFDVELASGHRVAMLATGDVVGEMSLVEKRPPTVSVRARSAARVLALPRDTLRERLESDAPFAARFYRAMAIFLSDRLRTTVARMPEAGDPAGGISNGQEAFEAEHALDEGVLDTLHVAGDRMRRLLGLLAVAAD